MYERLNNLIDIEKLNNINILLVGVGGVGSFVFEVLIRSGIKNITIVDYDTYELSNLNRQLHSSIDVIGKKKVMVLSEYANKINKDINVNVIDEYISDKSNIDFSKFNFIIDACDSIIAKVYLIKKANELNIPIIVSCGAGNRIDDSNIQIGNLKNVCGDPLAKKLRYELNKINFNKNVKVIYSKEIPIKSKTISSYVGITSIFGIKMANYVIKEVINNGN